METASTADLLLRADELDWSTARIDLAKLPKAEVRKIAKRLDATMTEALSENNLDRFARAFSAHRRARQVLRDLHGSV